MVDNRSSTFGMHYGTSTFHHRPSILQMLSEVALGKATFHHRPSILHLLSEVALGKVALARYLEV
jgi:hypothetical protein